MALEGIPIPQPGAEIRASDIAAMLEFLRTLEAATGAEGVTGGSGSGSAFQAIPGLEFALGRILDPADPAKFDPWCFEWEEVRSMRTGSGSPKVTLAVISGGRSSAKGNGVAVCCLDIRTHSPDEPVVLFRFTSGQGENHWYFYPSDTGTPFWAKIKVATADGTNRWKYTWEEVKKTGVGYAGWASDSTLRSNTDYGYARNTLENMNTSAGVQGNGVNISGPDFPSGFSVQPCPNGAIVRMEMVLFSVSGTFYAEPWFTYSNAVDGTCT